MLNNISKACLNRLRSYKPPTTSWYNLPYTRRAAVLILLHPNASGDLNVVLTLRGSNLSSFSGQAAFPGGKADFTRESAFAVARREAYEEIGFPLIIDHDRYVFESLTELPAYLARNWLVVRPCVAFISKKGPGPDSVDLQELLSIDTNTASEEVAAVFTVPFHKFLSSEQGWYKGSWQDWSGLRWRQHIFSVPPSSKEDIVTNGLERNSNQKYPVWGLTARMLVDSAALAYAQEPEMQYLKKDGDEILISEMIDRGELGPKRDRQREMEMRFSDLFGDEFQLLKSRL
ncbi:NUDIX hydrolase domain-like protein [Lipomyces oligophaga]|uniref:NUDIX hydrolase domain-like protein n=1 Tax=Lipomyces oligophaga TaxID=45792 RepID=UPI0034CF3F66